MEIMFSTVMHSLNNMHAHAHTHTQKKKRKEKVFQIEKDDEANKEQLLKTEILMIFIF